MLRKIGLGTRTNLTKPYENHENPASQKTSKKLMKTIKKSQCFPLANMKNNIVFQMENQYFLKRKISLVGDKKKPYKTWWEPWKWIESLQNVMNTIKHHNTLFSLTWKNNDFHKGNQYFSKRKIGLGTTLRKLSPFYKKVTQNIRGIFISLW